MDLFKKTNILSTANINELQIIDNHPSITTNGGHAVDYHSLINSGEMKLKILLTWRDYAIGLRRKRKKMNDILNRSNKINKIENMNNINNASLNILNNIIHNRDGSESESEIDNDSPTTNDKVRKFKSSTFGINNFKVSVIVSTSDSIVKTHKTNYVKLQRASMPIERGRPKTSSSKFEMQRNRQNRASSIRRRLAIPDGRQELPFQIWQPNCLKMLRRLYCTPITIIMFFSILAVNCTTNWIHFEGMKSIIIHLIYTIYFFFFSLDKQFAGLFRICNLTFTHNDDNSSETSTITSFSYSSKPDVDCFFGFIFKEGN